MFDQLCVLCMLSPLWLLRNQPLYVLFFFSEKVLPKLKRSVLAPSYSRRLSCSAWDRKDQQGILIQNVSIIDYHISFWDYLNNKLKLELKH